MEADVTQKAIPPPPKPLRGLQILFVEDSPDNRLLVSRMLKLAGAEVSCAVDGEKGVHAAKTSSYDVILMDLQMPIKDGFEATAELRSLGFRNPIIAVTAHAIKGDREHCLKSGFDGYVPKPVDRTLLTSEILTQYNRHLNSFSKALNAL